MRPDAPEAVRGQWVLLTKGLVLGWNSKWLEFFLFQFANQVSQWVKNPPAMQETQEMRVRSLGQEESLEEGMATHSSILAWRISWTEEPGRLQFIGSQQVGQN